MDRGEDTRTRILLALVTHEGAVAPSIREVGARVGLRSSDSTWEHLQVLRRRGLVTWEPGRARTLRATVCRVPGAGE